MGELSSSTNATETVIRIDGACTIERASALKSILLEGLGAPGDTRIDVAGVTDADLSFLQLLCAGHRQAISTGKRLILEGKLSGPIVRRAREAGFARQRGCTPDGNEECLWMGV